MTQLDLGSVRYNPSAGAFEACVDFRTSGRTMRFPCQISGPVTMDMDHVRAGLTRHAMKMFDTGTPLMSHI